MKKTDNFWESLERYGWRVAKTLSPALPWIMGAIILLVMTSSVSTKNESVVTAESLRVAAIRATSVGDYPTARMLWNKDQSQMTSDKEVLGSESETEDLIYPERVVEREIEKYQALLVRYNGHRDILLKISRLCGEIGKSECEREYWERARILDPNNPIFE